MSRVVQPLPRTQWMRMKAAMLVPFAALTLVYVACTPNSDAAGITTPPPASPTPPTPATVSGGVLTTTVTRSPMSVAQCQNDFPGPRYAACRWSVGTFAYCGGAPPSAEQRQPRPGCVCNGCLTDADCVAKPGGKCSALPPASGCGPSASVCAYPGDPCGPGGACAAPRRCGHDTLGGALCAGPAPPTP
jgi:hypothetical protein